MSIEENMIQLLIQRTKRSEQFWEIKDASEQISR